MAGNGKLRCSLIFQVLMILLPLLFISTLHTALASTSSYQAYKTYIETACKRTTYPQLCYKSLSPYASKIKGDHKKLCETALSMTLNVTRVAASTISKILKQKGLTRYETADIKDCIANIKDSVDQLKRSLHAINHLSGSDRKLQIDKIKTWVSAALTDDSTCTDEFDQGQGVSDAVKSKITVVISKISRPTSNALALINEL